MRSYIAQTARRLAQTSATKALARIEAATIGDLAAGCVLLLGAGLLVSVAEAASPAAPLSATYVYVPCPRGVECIHDCQSAEQCQRAQANVITLNVRMPGALGWAQEAN